MRLILLLLICCLLQHTKVGSQTEYIYVNSSILEESRQIKLQLPRNYNSTEKEYPILIVLDGDYLFEPFAGNVDYLSYWEIIPEVIVVGINQVGHRREDGLLDEVEELPISTGADFYEFIGLEVLKYLDDNYRTTPFAIIAGLDYMANFSNFFLLKKNPLFKGYINFSPDVTPLLPDRLKRKLDKIDTKIWYYLATSENDIRELKIKIKNLDSYLSVCNNPNFNYRFDIFEGKDHFSFVANAIPKALNSIFEAYGPITDLEYNSKLLTSSSPSNYLEDRYFTIQELYALKTPIRIVDFLKTADAIEEKELWGDYQNLSRLAKKEVSKTVLHHYFQGLYFERIGQPKKAIREYNGAYGLQSAGYLNSDVLLGKADALKQTFGY
jgi:predicted alpha/beta superfamily hydrolase